MILNNKGLLNFISQLKLGINEISKTIEENRILKNEALPSQVLIKNDLNNAEYQNIILEEALNFKTKFEAETNFRLHFAYSSTTPHDGAMATTLTIDLGSNDGIKKDMAVIIPTGLVGIIREVHEYRSSVSLITNLNDEQNSKAIAVKLKENGDTTGLIEDFINQETRSGTPYFVMKKIGEKDSIEVGNTVITSGLGEVFPEGIRVGTISSISNSSTLTKEAKINLEFNPSRIPYVFIVD